VCDMKTAITPGDHPWKNKEAYGIIEYVSEHNHPHDVPICLTVGISEDFPADNPCEYEFDEQYFEDSFELMLCIGRGEFVPEEAGEFLGSYEPPKVKQTHGQTGEQHQVTMKGIKSAIAGVMMTPRTEQIIEPNKGVVNCLKSKQITQATLIIDKDYPRDARRKIAVYAEEDNIEVEFKMFNEIDYTKETYVGSNVTSMLGQFERATGWELNPYHRDAIPHLEGAAQVDGQIHMRYKEQGVYRSFYDEPMCYYRYHPFQLPYLAAQMRIGPKNLSCFFFCSSQPLKEARRFNYMELGGPDQRYLPMLCDYKGERCEYRLAKTELTERTGGRLLVLDETGNDLFFSRRARIKCHEQVPLFKDVLEVRKKFPAVQVGVVTSTCFSPRLVEDQETEYAMLLVEADNVRVGDMHKLDEHLAEVIVKSEEIRDSISRSPVMILPGTTYKLKRPQVRYWFAQTEQERSSWMGYVLGEVLVAKSTMSELNPRREVDGYYWAKSSLCDHTCLVRMNDRYGEVTEFCREDHTCDIAHAVRGATIGTFDDYYAVVKNSVRIEEDYRNEYLLEPMIVDDERDGVYAIRDNT